MSADTSSSSSKRGTRHFVTPRVAWLLALVAAGSLLGCGFAETTPPGGATGGKGGTGQVTPGVSGASALPGGGAGTAGSSSPTPTGGAGAGSGGQGGDVSQGGSLSGGSGGAAGGSGGSASGGMSVAGGPPAFSTKPLSVVAYSPYRDGQAPGGVQPTQAQVREDLELLKPLVDGVRVYGTDGANAYIPALCDELGIELHIGAWIDGLTSDGPNVAALAAVVNENHPSIKTAIVGNEVLARSTKNGMTEEKLIAFIEQAKAAITVPVTIAAADTYPQWMIGRPNLANSVDLLIWHTYGWWSGINIEAAYPLVSSRYDDMMAKYPGKRMLLGETGWPSMHDHASVPPAAATTAVGSEANQARFYREALAGFRARNLPMWMFSSIDEKWKATSGEGDVGAYWGIFDSQRQPKAAASELLLALP